MIGLGTTDIPSLAKRTEDALNELQRFIDESFPAAAAAAKIGVRNSEKLHISKRAWIKHESKLPDIKDRLRDCRIKILTLSLETCASQVCVRPYISRIHSREC